jgi:hypothetical protein
MSDPALAIGREYGIVEGQIFSLMHPAFMFFLLGASLYAGYLGFQWRRVRELGTEIKGLKAQRDASAPKSEEGAERPASPLDATIASLESVRTVFFPSCMAAQLSDCLYHKPWMDATKAYIYCITYHTCRRERI